MKKVGSINSSIAEYLPLFCLSNSTKLYFLNDIQKKFSIVESDSFIPH